MSVLLNLLYARLINEDFTKPETFLDLSIACFLIIGFLIYMHKFPSFRVILGTIFLISCSVLFFLGGFFFTATLIGFASFLVLISLPLIFSSEIRHYLGKVGRFPFLKIPKITKSQKSRQFIKILSEAVYELAEKNIGGTLVLARQTGLQQTIETGEIIDAKFSAKLIQNIFFPKSPMHDGAIIIRGERIWAAGCLLPMHSGIKLDPPFGTRHKSGLSITEDTDAVSIIISEQRGEVSVAENGKLIINLPRVELMEVLNKLL